MKHAIKDEDARWLLDLAVLVRAEHRFRNPREIATRIERIANNRLASSTPAEPDEPTYQRLHEQTGYSLTTVRSIIAAYRQAMSQRKAEPSGERKC